MNKTVDCLNEAFRRDPSAMQTLCANRVPCNQELADDLFVAVQPCAVLPGDHFQVGMLGVLNGVLAANGLPLVAMKFVPHTNEEGVRGRFVGFCEYVT